VVFEVWARIRAAIPPFVPRAAASVRAALVGVTVTTGACVQFVLMVIASMVMFVTPQPARRGIAERVGAWATWRFRAFSGSGIAGSSRPPWRFKNAPHTTSGNTFGGQAHQ
jgi:hypothetical protein